MSKIDKHTYRSVEKWDNPAEIGTKNLKRNLTKDTTSVDSKPTVDGSMTLHSLE